MSKIFIHSRELISMDESTYFVTTLEAQYSEDGPQYVVKVPVGLVERLKLTEGSSVYLEVVAKE